jgi:hypothetical protein
MKLFSLVTMTLYIANSLTSVASLSTLRGAKSTDQYKETSVVRNAKPTDQYKETPVIRDATNAKRIVYLNYYDSSIY